MAAFETYISDFDGTLCDTLDANIAAYGLAFRDAGLEFDEDAYRNNFGLRFDAMMQAISPGMTAEQAALVAERKSVHYPEQTSLITINHELVDVLRHAKEHGAKLGLATTAKAKNARAVLGYFGLESLFDASIFGEDVTHGKPDPECYQKVMRQLDATPDTTLIFEDSLIGLEAARATGAHVLKVAI
jgi:beta-phosphoglucomutase